MHAYAGRQFVQSLWWSLVWPGREANSRPTVREADMLLTEPTRQWLNINETYMEWVIDSPFLPKEHSFVPIQIWNKQTVKQWNSENKQWKTGPAVIKLFESENVLKCKNRLPDFIETLCLFSKLWENYLRHFTISLNRYNYLAIFLWLSGNSYGKILENILKLYDSGPDVSYASRWQLLYKMLFYTQVNKLLIQCL